MRSKYLIWFSVCGLFLIMIISWYGIRTNTLQTMLNHCTLPLNSVQAKTRAISLDGQSLVFYQLRSDKFPTFTVRRALIRNDASNFKLILKGLQGSIISYLKNQPSSEFIDTLAKYRIKQNFIDHPLLSLAILGYDQILLDVELTAKQTAPNQILLNATIMENGYPRLHLRSKFSPDQGYEDVLSAIRGQKLAVEIVSIDPKWKERLDAYALSNGTEFLTDRFEYILKF